MNVNIPGFGSPEGGLKYRPVELPDSVLKGALSLASGIDSIGDSFMKASDLVAKLKDEELAAREAEETSTTMNTFKVEGTKLLRDLPSMGGTRDYQKLTAEWCEKRIGELLENVSPRIRTKLKSEMIAQKTQMEISALGMGAQVARKRADDSFNKSVTLAVESGDLDTAQTLINGNELYTPEQKEEKIREVGETIATNEWTSLNETDPLAAAKLLEDPDFTSGLGATTRKGLHRMSSTAMQSYYNGIRIGYARRIYDGQPPKPADIDSDIAAGRLPEPQAAIFRASAIKREVMSKLSNAENMTPDETRLSLAAGFSPGNEAQNIYGKDKDYNSILGKLVSYSPYTDHEGRKLEEITTLIATADLSDHDRLQFMQDAQTLLSGDRIERFNTAYSQAIKDIEPFIDAGALGAYRNMTGVLDMDSLQNIERARREVYDELASYAASNKSATRDELSRYGEWLVMQKAQISPSYMSGLDYDPSPYQEANAIMRQRIAEKGEDWHDRIDYARPLPDVLRDASLIFAGSSLEEDKQVFDEIETNWWLCNVPGTVSFPSNEPMVNTTPATV